MCFSALCDFIRHIANEFAIRRKNIKHQVCLRISPGEILYSFLNAVERWACDEKPQVDAIVDSERAVSVISSCALVSRVRRMNLCSVMPSFSLKTVLR